MPSLVDIWQPPPSITMPAWQRPEAVQSALLGVTPAVTSSKEDQWSRERYPLYRFVQEAWAALESQPFIPGWHIDAFCQHLMAVADRRIKRLLINVPLRSAKSVVQMVFFPAWVWITNPAERFLCTSFAKDLALQHAVLCRRLMMSPWYRERWEHRFRLRGDQNVKSRYENNKGGAMVTVAVGGATGSSGSVLLVDDLHSRDDDDSPTRAEIKAAKDFFNGDFANCLVDPQTSCIVVTGQRVAIDDISADLLAKGNYVHLKIRQEYIPPPPGEAKPVSPVGWSDPRTELGELMHPARWGPAQVAMAKRDGMRRYMAHHQQDPEGSGGSLFNDAWWPVFTNWPNFALFKKIIQSWDMRFKDDKEAGSFVVGQVWGLTPNGVNVWLLDEVRGRWDFNETKDAFRALCQKWPQARGKLIENKANGPAIYSAFRSMTHGLILIDVEGSKLSRAEKHTETVKAGNVWIPADTLAPWIGEWRIEVKHFPSEPDDRVDAATQAWDYLLPRQLADDPKTEERKAVARRRRLMQRVPQTQTVTASRTGA